MGDHITESMLQIEKQKGTQHRRRDKGHTTPRWFVKDSQNPIILYLTKITQ